MAALCGKIFFSLGTHHGRANRPCEGDWVSEKPIASKCDTFFSLGQNFLYNIDFLSIFQVHGKDAVLAYDSDEDSISEATSPTSHAANPLSSPASEPHNNNNDSSHISQQQSQHASVAPCHTQHQPLLQVHPWHLLGQDLL